MSLSFVKELGRGANGRVALYEDRSGTKYAIKISTKK